METFKDGTLRYYHTSPNHGAELKRPMLVRTVDELRIVFETVELVNIVERVALQRHNTQWKVRVVTNVSSFSII